MTNSDGHFKQINNLQRLVSNSGGQLEVMRIVLLAGKSMPEHMTRGEATVQCIEGEVEFQGSNGAQRMQPGDFVHLEPRALRALTAVQDASLLVTLCLQAG